MGKIYNAGYGGIAIGYVDSDGKIYNAGYGGSLIGRIDGGILAGGAALLLLDLNGGSRGEKIGLGATIFACTILLITGMFKCAFLTKGGRIGLIVAGVLTGVLVIILAVGKQFEVSIVIGVLVFLIFFCGNAGAGIGSILRTVKERKETNTVQKWLKMFLLSFFFGMLGVDRFCVRKIGTGILKLLTLGGAGIWWLVDWCKILSGRFEDKDGNVI